MKMLLTLLLLLAPTLRAQDTIVFILDDVGEIDLEELMADGRCPNIKRVADYGIKFTNAKASPTCMPTRYAIDFGGWRVAPTDKVCYIPTNRTPPSSLISLADLVSPVGVSPGFFGKWHEGANPNSLNDWQRAPGEHGYSVYRGVIPGGNVTTCGGTSYWDWVRVEDGVQSTSNKYQPTVMFTRWYYWWTSTPGPKLAVYSAQLAHDPFHRPDALWLPNGYPDTPTDRDKYEAMIVALDTQVGAMLPLLTPDDLLIIIGDNGTPRDVAGTQRAKTTTFWRGIDVPLIVAGAGIPSGQTSPALVHAVDIYATIAERYGRTVPLSSPSMSLMPLALGQAQQIHSYVVCGTRGDNPLPADIAAVSPRYKFRRTGTPTSVPSVQEWFFDTVSDPLELVDLIDSTDPSIQYEIELHRAWLNSIFPP